MTTENRLAASQAKPKVTVERLQELADSLNSEWWVPRMGRYYYVGREIIGDTARHFLAWQPLTCR